MSEADIASALAVGAAACVAFGDVIHQRAAYAVPAQDVGALGPITTLLRHWPWWLGTLISLVGFGLQAAALGLGSVVLVQTLMVSSLLFALVIESRWAKRKVTRYQWGSAILLAGAIAVVVSVGNPVAGQPHATPQSWMLVAAVIGPITLLCVEGARRRPGPRRAVLLAVASGMMWGLMAVLTKGVVDSLDHGIVSLLTNPESYALAVVGITGVALQQSAFHAGTLVASLPTMTVTEPVIASLLGIMVLGESFRTNTFGAAALVFAVAIMVAATVALARSEAAAHTVSGDASGIAVPPTPKAA
ncbi:DMT family transporter [Mycobacterium sp. D16R24]|uniref:DMT family transporter n=1 Tax=Mycobacterium sp. D16R24 TaxID=1855656 RepID=UPI000993A5DF|nr:DMT family transporter [Mycobacterium sp. D16R24]